MAQSKPIKVIKWFDYVWPWCYIGLARLDKIGENTSIKVDRRPYLLRPERASEGEPREIRDGETETELTAAWQERAKEAGVVMRRPPLYPNTKLTHEATMYAKGKGLDSEFHHAAAKAYWEMGVNLGDMAVLKDIAEGCGIEWGELSQRLESGHYRERLLQEDKDAKDGGVGVVPTYDIEGQVLPGDVSLEDLKDAVEKATSG